MSAAKLEHVNVTVSDPEQTAKMLGDLFGWKVRWQGASIAGGETFHVGTDEDYVAVYATGPDAAPGSSYACVGGLNHIAITVNDLDAIEAKVIAAGLKPINHAEYEPGRRFYFYDPDGIEYEVVSYQGKDREIGFSGGIDHVHVYVRDRAEGAEWYESVLGLKPVEAFAQWAADEAGPLTISDQENRIHLALFGRDAAQKVSLAFGVSAAEYSAWKARLSAQGLTLAERDHGLSRSLYLADPWGNEIELTCDDLSADTQKSIL